MCIPKTGFILFFTVINILQIFSTNFEFKYSNGDDYRIVTEVFEYVKENDKLIFTTEILNRIAVSIQDVDENSGEIQAVYQISEKGVGGYHWDSEETATFRRNNKGVYSLINDDESLPSVRNIPQFPDKNLKPGDSWNFFAEEIHDLFPFFSIDYRLHIPFRVFYTYEDQIDKDGKILDKILINYNILYENEVLQVAHEHPDWGNYFPEKITGSFNQIFLWDNEAGRPYSVEDQFEYKYYLSTGATYTFSGVSYGKVIIAEDMDREEIAKDINQKLEDEGIDNIKASPEEDGVKITIENINFLPDSSILEDIEIAKLKYISEILLKFTGRDILIGGHTARFGTEESCQILSEERAASVASFFLENKIRNESEIVTRGFGSLKPVGDNTTVEGQEKNRRVEITILEN